MNEKDNVTTNRTAHGHDTGGTGNVGTGNVGTAVAPAKDTKINHATHPNFERLNDADAGVYLSTLTRGELLDMILRNGFALYRNGATDEIVIGWAGQV